MERGRRAVIAVSDYEGGSTVKRLSVHVMAGTCALACAGTAAAADAQQSIEEITVTGFRESYATALASKRDAVGVTDGISSEGIGRFPDLNVGEALQRIPGVQINR